MFWFLSVPYSPRFLLHALSRALRSASGPLTLKMSSVIDGGRTDSFPMVHVPQLDIVGRKLEWLQPPMCHPEWRHSGRTCRMSFTAHMALPDGRKTG